MQMSKYYPRALEDLDNVNFLHPNNAFNLNSCANVKRLLKDYQRALEDLDKVNFLEPNNAFTFKK